MYPRQRNVPRSLARRLWGLLLLPLLAVAPGLEAQQTGTVTGRVTEAGSGEPVPSVQIFIEGLDIGALTQQNGRYLLQNVPAGTHTVSAERIGYRTQTAEVTVGSGETVVQNFQVSEEALQLDEVIVTGTPGGTQRRAIGNAVTRLDAAEVTATRPVSNMQEMLTARTPGLDFQRATGNIGEGSRIQIRGYSSLSLGTQPLIYIDGVRVDNSTEQGPDIPNLSGTSGSSALDDLNPNDIASIEVIKGPAAATLYGTEASAGVIQIITKRGQTGDAQFDFTISQGTNFLMDPAGKIGSQYACRFGVVCTEDDVWEFNMYEFEKNSPLLEAYEALPGDTPRYPGTGDIFDYGRSQRYNLGIRGGTEAVTYYVSTDYSDTQGIVDYNWQERFSGRANLGVLISDQIDLDLSLGYVDGKTRFASGPLQTGGIWPSLMWGMGPVMMNFSTLQASDQRGYVLQLPEDFSLIETTRDYSRFTGSATLSHNPTDWLSHRLIMGIDKGNDENQILVPRSPQGADGPFGNLSLGDVTLDRPQNTEITLDYSLSVNYDLNESVGFTSSVGAQYYSSEYNQVSTVGRVFPSPVIRSIEGATDTDATQTFRQNKSLGVFFQQEMGWNDRVFLTAAVRGDDNSAFGAEFDAAIYPKFSGTWVISEEPFWNVDFINSLRLRSAWGQAGRQPGTFAAVTLFSPAVGPGGSAAVSPSTLGNPDIGPEVSSELEVGFDMALLDDRVSTEFTYYYQQVDDALTTLPLAPTNGFPGSVDANVGQLDNWGFETALNARVLSLDDYALDLGLSLSYTMNEIKDLGERPQTNSFRVGFPYPATTSDIILGMGGDPFTCDAGTADRRRGGEAVPCSQTQDYELLLGPTYSPWNWSADATVTLFDDLQIFGLVDAEHGRWMWDYNISCRHTLCVANTRDAVTLDDPIYVASSLQSDTHPADDRYAQKSDASYIKLRELGARYQLPQSLVDRVGVDRASFSVAARDLWYLWTKQQEVPPRDIRQEGFQDRPGANIPSPELADPNISGFALFQWPPLTTVEATLRVSF